MTKLILGVFAFISFTLPACLLAEEELITRTFPFSEYLAQRASGSISTGEVFSHFDGKADVLSGDQWLRDHGIQFGPGAMAEFRKEEGRLLVRNTAEQLYQIESLMTELRKFGEVLVRLTLTEIDLTPSELEKIKDTDHGWLLPLPAQKAADSAEVERNSSPYISFLQELSRPPSSNEEDLTPSGRGVVGVFTTSQLQAKLDNLPKDVKALLTPEVSFMKRPGEPGLIQDNERRYGLIAEQDKDQVSLSVFLPEHGKALLNPGDHLVTPYRVTFRDGDHLVLSAPREDGGNRVVIIKAELIDPGGVPINPR